MTREQAQILRLVLMCAAWAIGQTLTYGLSFQGFDVVIPAGLAAGVYIATDDLGRPSVRGPRDLKYWRGRQVDDVRRDRRVDDSRRDRWN